MPLVSVIVPNYNHAKFLNNRIESIINQTYQDFEIIILDDCSTDNSREIIEKYRGNNKVSHIVYNDVNGGSTFKQWQKGINLTKGELIWIAESDDYSDKKFLEKVLNEFHKNNNVGLVYTSSIIVDENENILSSMKTPGIFELHKSKDFIVTKMSSGNSISNASGAVFKKDAIRRINNDFEKLNYCGDWLFWVNVALNSEKVGYLNTDLNYFRRHPHNVSYNSEAKGLAFFEGEEILKYIFKRIELSFSERLNIYKRWGHKYYYSLKINEYNISTLTHIKIFLSLLKLNPFIILFSLLYSIKDGLSNAKASR